MAGLEAGSDISGYFFVPHMVAARVLVEFMIKVDIKIRNLLKVSS